MGANGILEAFVHATASPAQLRAQSRWMVLFSALFIGGVVTGASGVGGMQWDDQMLVWANVLNLGARAIYGWIFAQGYFGEKGGEELVRAGNVRPCIPGLLAFGVSGIVARWSESRFDQVGERLVHAGICIGCGLVSLAIW